MTLRDLHSRATPAPWTTRPEVEYFTGKRYQTSRETVEGGPPNYPVLLRMAGPALPEADAALIVHLRNRAYLYADLEDAARALIEYENTDRQRGAPTTAQLRAALAALTENDR